MAEGTRKIRIDVFSAVSPSGNFKPYKAKEGIFAPTSVDLLHDAVDAKFPKDDVRFSYPPGPQHNPLFRPDTYDDEPRPELNADGSKNLQEKLSFDQAVALTLQELKESIAEGYRPDAIVFHNADLSDERNKKAAKAILEAAKAEGIPALIYDEKLSAASASLFTGQGASYIAKNDTPIATLANAIAVAVTPKQIAI